MIVPLKTMVNTQRHGNGNIVGFAQQMLINRLTKSEDDKEPPAEKSVESRPPKKLKPARA